MPASWNWGFERDISFFELDELDFIDRYQFLPLGLGFGKFQDETYVSVGSAVDLRSGKVREKLAGIWLFGGSGLSKE
ncbi:hypothetical protein RhiirA4_489069 [Rhizophagus irregularis]|uniref:Uncharacterized protein n=1 Tax=Rhizophagus irregularis TaxID=588596 RepID=A0A2I1HSG2_9GLOM|nr:hypothetical protein RhiirA4_487325 [Rhizophagus irregularis]PKY62505.1 hypothetical protein RhiirA4_489069 [Rhizophagus irregularis]